MLIKRRDRFPGMYCAGSIVVLSDFASNILRICERVFRGESMRIKLMEHDFVFNLSPKMSIWTYFKIV